jgi:hypothetical protein
METIIIKSGKESLMCPGVRYQINPKQQVLIIGYAGIVKDQTVSFEIPMGYIAMSLGRLSDQQLVFQKQMLNSLERDNWDFKSYVNPIVILLADKNAGIPVQAPKNGQNKILRKD